MRNQKGFTLIELIIVIVVLGILAVTAAPQFINFAGDARVSSVQGVKGAVSGAAQVIQSKSAIEGETALADSDTPTPDVEGITTSYGYPTADATGIIAAAGLDASSQKSDPAADFAYLIDGGDTIYIVPTDLITTEDSGELASTVTYTGTNCYVQYDEATGTTAADKYSVTSVTSGCVN